MLIKDLPKKIEDKKIIKFFKKKGVVFAGDLRRNEEKQ